MPVRRLSSLCRVVAEALGAAALTIGVCWAILALLAGGDTAAGEIGGFLSADLAGTAAAVAASTGAPVDWTVAGIGGRLYPITFLLAGSPLALLVAGPLAGAAVVGARTRAMLERGGHAAGVAVAAATYAAALACFAAVGTGLAGGSLVRLAVPAAPLPPAG
ncbi:hypothetical protein K1W54_39765, partial [Micromonospora sp. CPCC 205371]|nr:hypothetical protein [Micromonospora sp. CPCC 205371]